MMNNLKATILTAAICIAMSANVFAQSFTVSPTNIFFGVEPSNSKTQEITIKNTANKKKSFTISLQDWEQNTNGDPKYMDLGTSPSSCGKWVKVTPSLVELGPNETRKVAVTISVPGGDNATKWSAVVIQPAQEQQPTAAADKDLRVGALPSGMIAIPLYQSPASNKNIKATINNFRSAGQSAYAADVVNKGDKILKANVQTVISNIQTGEEFELEPTEMVVLPNATRNVKLVLPTDIPKGKYSLTAILNYARGADLEGVQREIEVK